MFYTPNEQAKYLLNITPVCSGSCFGTTPFQFKPVPLLSTVCRHRSSLNPFDFFKPYNEQSCETNQ